MYAASAGHVECVRTLRQAFNANPILENSDKKTARQLAEEKAGTPQDNGHSECVETNYWIQISKVHLNVIATAKRSPSLFVL